MFRKMAVNATLLGSALLLSACGMLHERVAHPDKRGHTEYYKGTQRDLEYLGIPVNGTNSRVYASFPWCYLTVVCAVGNLLSLPVDLVVDTAYLPHDAARADRHEKLSQTQALLAPAHGYLEVDFSQTLPQPSAGLGIAARGYEVEYYGKKDRLYVYVDKPPLEQGVFRMAVPLRPGYDPANVRFFFSIAGNDLNSTVWITLKPDWQMVNMPRYDQFKNEQRFTQQIVNFRFQVTPYFQQPSDAMFTLH